MATRSSRLWGPLAVPGSLTIAVGIRPDTWLIKNLTLVNTRNQSTLIEVLLNGTSETNTLFAGRLDGPRTLSIDTWIVLEPNDQLRWRRSNITGHLIVGTAFGAILPLG